MEPNAEPNVFQVMPTQVTTKLQVKLKNQGMHFLQ